MKTSIIKLSITLFLSLVIVTSCEKDEADSINPEASDINAYIFGLDYDQEALLNLQNTGGAPSETTPIGEPYNDDQTPDQGTILTCTVQDYGLESNFSDVAILRPNIDVIYPGSLVAGNQGMLDGDPNALSISKGAVTMRLDLPGIGQEGVITIDNPSKSVVDTQIDDALQWWFDNSNGNVNYANSSYSASTLYSSSQLSMDLGLNLAWADNDVASQLQFTNTTERRVASLAFKQVFFTISMDTPSSPAAMFGDDVSLQEVKSQVNGDSPAAYVATVSYGRIIMMRMETEYNETTADVDLDAALSYASGLDVNATFNSQFESVLATSSIKILTLGGNAEVAVSAVNNADIESGPGGLNHIITGENALLSRNNPGVPIAYTIRYLKDNSTAKMGYTTSYSVPDCGSGPFVHEEVTVKNNSYHDTRFYFRYRPQNTDYFLNGPRYEINQGSQTTKRPPHGAFDVKIIFESQIGFGDFEQIDSEDLNYIYSDKCFEFEGGDWNDHGTVNDDC